MMLSSTVKHKKNSQRMLNQYYKKTNREYNITIKPTKCTFDASEIQYTGHLLNAKGLPFDIKEKKRTDKVHNFPKPTTQQELKSILGFATYFHEHI